MVGSLQNAGFSFKAIGDAQTTTEEVQRLLHSLGQHEIASSLRQRLELGKAYHTIEILQLCNGPHLCT